MNDATDGEISSSDRRVLRRWKLAFDQAFQNDTSEFSSWVSSYTGEPIPSAEMEDWLDGTIQRILSSGPRAVLEIGCGTGAIANRLTPHVDRYCGVDLSPSAIEQLKEAFGEAAATHTFICCAAHEVGSYFGQEFDAVVFNSVIQYFPDAQYLEKVLAASVSLLKPGGSIFIGDVRHSDLKPMLIASIALATAPADASQDDVRIVYDQRLERDHELVLSPGHFHALDVTFPRISKVRTLLKFGQFKNELTNFRYDVLVALDDPETDADIHSVYWSALSESIGEVEQYLQRFPDRTVSVLNVRNARLAQSLIVQRQITAPTADWTAGDLRQVIAQLNNSGEQPYAFEDLGRRLGREVSVMWNRCCLDAFDIVFGRKI